MAEHLKVFYVFFFQAEDGIRDDLVTGVQTCALPICGWCCSAICRFTLASACSARAWPVPLAVRKNRRSRPWSGMAKGDRKSTRLNSSHQIISYAVFCLKKKKNSHHQNPKLHTTTSISYT